MSCVRAFACRLRGEEHETTVYAYTPGKAKRMFLDTIRDCCPDLPYTDIRVRCLGGFVTTDHFRRTAANRGVPFARIGMRVRVGDASGVIVGNNASANFDVLFDEDSRYKGETLNCHPQSEITYFDDEGSEIAL